MPKESVLIISLGLSPAVVTETVDALLDEGIDLRRVYTITTQHPDIVNKCIPLLIEEFKNNPRYRGKIEFKPYEGLIPTEDIVDAMDNLLFMSNLARLMKSERDRGVDIYLGMAGGRKTMSAAMALLAQIYSAKAIVHVLVPTEVEEKGRIDKLMRLKEEELEKAKEREKALHPSGEERKLVVFPVVGAFWMLDNMLKALKGQGGVDGNTLNILKFSGLLDENGKPTDSGKYLLRILEDVHLSPPISLRNPKEKIRISHPQHMPRGYEQFVEKLARNPWVNEIRDIEFVNSSETGIRDVRQDGTIIYQYSDGSKAVKFIISTTATTRSQAEWIRSTLE